jgi:hypothetical protein
VREVIIRRFEEGWGIELVGVAQDGRVFTIRQHVCKDHTEEDARWNIIMECVGMIKRRLSNDLE